MPVEPFIGDVFIAGFNFAPRGYALCNGQLLPINQNQALFSILGTTYGGNGQTNFALPDLRGRVPIHTLAAHPLGESGGESTHSLAISEIPAHTHGVNALQEFGSSANPSGNLLATATGMMGNAYGVAANLTAMAPSSVGPAGGSQAHQNTQPSLCLNFYIALIGIFPSRD